MSNFITWLVQFAGSAMHEVYELLKQIIIEIYDGISWAVAVLGGIIYDAITWLAHRGVEIGEYTIFKLLSLVNWVLLSVVSPIFDLIPEGGITTFNAWTAGISWHCSVINHFFPLAVMLGTVYAYITYRIALLVYVTIKKNIPTM